MWEGGWVGVAWLLLGLCMGGWWWMYVGGVFMSLVIYVWAFVGLLLGPPLVMATCVSMQ